MAPFGLQYREADALCQLSSLKGPDYVKVEQDGKVQSSLQLILWMHVREGAALGEDHSIFHQNQRLKTYFFDFEKAMKEQRGYLKYYVKV